MPHCPKCESEIQQSDKNCYKCGHLLLANESHSHKKKQILVKDSVRQELTDYQLIDHLLNINDFCDTYIVKKNEQQFILKLYTVDEKLSSFNQTAKTFKEECRFFSSIKNKGIPLIHDYYSKNGDLFLFLSFPEGTFLFEKIYPEGQKNPVLPDIDMVLHWARQLARILFIFHAQRPFSILHRNLNPYSIFINKANDIQLIDFGILSSLLKNIVHTNQQHPFCDPSINSLQASSQLSDIYAFGRIIDFMITGSIPSSYKESPKIISENYKSTNPSYYHLKKIISHCCNTSISDRYQNVKTIVEELDKNYLKDADLVETNTLNCSCGGQNALNARFCSRCGQLLHLQEQEHINSDSKDSKIKITYDENAHEKLIESYQDSKFSSFSHFALRESLDEIHSNPGFNTLICLDMLPQIDKLPHQHEAALTVLSKMRGRALLADEVGLGKTIEAGMVLKELLQRQLAKKVLIICPNQLLAQWQIELYEKFDEFFLVMGRDIDTSLAWFCPKLIAPYHIIEQRFHIDILINQKYDLVILDEAHYLNEPHNWKVLRTVKSIRKKYFLLVSATPMHNELTELYNIITLLRPGHFGDLKGFIQRYGDKSSNTGTKNTSELKNIIKQVMIRNLRSEVAKDYPFPKRKAYRCEVEMTEQGKDFYNKFRSFYQTSVKNLYNRRFLFEMGELIERLSSSSDAFREYISISQLKWRIKKHLGDSFLIKLKKFESEYPHEMIQQKVQSALQYAETFISKGHKVLIFSQFNETTKYYYKKALNKKSLEQYCFLYDEKKEFSVNRKYLIDFKNAVKGILFCPGELSEGLNLQHASVMINVDLPWDPMKIEQRIGRIQRIGGADEIYIINIVLKDTIEDDILTILEKKIQMFEAVIGKVEEIIGNIDDTDDFRSMICNLYLDRDDKTDEGLTVKPEEKIENAINEAIERSSSDDKDNVMKYIMMAEDDEDDEDEEW